MALFAPLPSKTLLILYCCYLIGVLDCQVANNECHTVLENVDKGEINVRLEDVQNQNNCSCLWMISAPPNRRFHLRIQQQDVIDLPLSSLYRFILVLDNVTHNVPLQCKSCLGNLVGSILNVTFVRKQQLNVNVNNDSVELENLEKNNAQNYHNNNNVLITIFYQSFDPRRCKNPVPPENGLTVGKGRRIGDKIQYRCYEPYQVIGSKDNVCQKNSNGDLPIPSWVNPIPTCRVLDCRSSASGVVKLLSDFGSVVHPGYPESLISNANNNSLLLSCTWEVVVAPKMHISVQIEQVNLPNSKMAEAPLVLYNGKQTPDNVIAKLSGKVVPRNLTTTTGKLIVVFRGDSLPDMDGTSKYGFHIRYTAIPILCKPFEKKTLLHGKISGANERTVGSVVSFACDNGFILSGPTSITCLEKGEWSHAKPDCIAITIDESIRDPLAEFPPIFQDENENRSLSSREDGILGPRIQKEQLPHYHEDHKNSDDKSLIKNSILENNNGENLNTLNENRNEDVIKTTTAAAAVTAEIDENSDKATEKKPLFPEEPFPYFAVVLGVAVPLVLIAVAAFAFVIYRKRYPVRMNMGRKFETFENPIYEKNIKGVQARGMADPAELQHLTTVATK